MKLHDSLVREKMLVRYADRVDRRRVRLAVSAKGAKLIRDTDQRRADAFARVVKPLSARDRTEFARIMRTIVRKSER